VACYPPSRDQAGFATPAALVIGAAIALVAVWVVARGVGLLRLARGDADRAGYEYVMDGAQLIAAAEVVRSERPGPFAWTMRTDIGPADVIAEPERDKLSLAAVTRLDAASLTMFGVADPAALQERLAAAAGDPSVSSVSELDSAPLWRECGPTLTSAFGRGEHTTYAPAEEPRPGPLPAYWRVGEMWRIRIATPAGWRDDRLVRFTGNPRHPAATVVRRIWRARIEREKCAELLQALAAD